MCKRCEGTHKVSKYTKKHKTRPSEKAKQKQVPRCPLHRRMDLVYYCEDCSIAMCFTCYDLDHKGHSGDDLERTGDEMMSHLDGEVINDADFYLKEIKTAIQFTKQQAIKMKDDVDRLKKQTAAGYDAIIQRAKIQKRKQLEEIDNAYKHVEKILSETLDTHHTAQVTLESIHRFGKHLKRKGTDYDLITNVKGLVERSKKSKKEWRKLKTMNFEVKTEWDECCVDAKGVRVIEDGGYTVESDQIMTIIPTEDSEISGIAAYNNNVFIIHFNHDVIYLYDDMMKLKSSVKVNECTSLDSICVVQGENAIQYLVVNNMCTEYLWWLILEDKAGEVSLGEPIKHELGYESYKVVTDISGHALVIGRDSDTLHVYRKPGDEGRCVKLPDGVRKKFTFSMVVSDPDGGGYVILCKNEMVWLTKNGQVTRRCPMYNVDSACAITDIVHDGKNWLLTDEHGRRVHIVTPDGRHAGHLVANQKWYQHPIRTAFDPVHQWIWLGHLCAKDVRLTKIKHSPENIATFTVCATIPK